MSKRVGIIGGGISGLCVAYALTKFGVDVVLFEKNDAVGGNIRSNTQDGFLYEDGPNSTLTSRDLLALIDELGLTDEIAAPAPAAKKRFIVRDGKLIALPSGPISLVTTKVFSASTKIALLKEPFKRNVGGGNESAAAFFERRLGREIVDYAVDPFISGIYAGDPEKLAVEYAFPKLFEMERQFGSIVMGGVRSPKNKASKLPKGTPRSISFKGGMQILVNSLENKLGGAIRKNCGETKLSTTGTGKVKVISASRVEDFDAAVICTPAYVTSDLVEPLDPELARELAGIYYPPVSVVYLGYRNENVGIDPAGFGFLVPGVENRQVLGSLWTSTIFDGRSPSGHNLFTVFIGGSRNPELGLSGEDELLRIAKDELGSLMNISGEPAFSAVKKWPRAIPQYNIGYGSVIEAIGKFREINPNLFLCSNYYKGISVSDCVKNGGVTAKNVVAFLETHQHE